jgi:hypothetical protein
MNTISILCHKVNRHFTRFRGNAFDFQYIKNAPQRCASLSNRLKLVLKHP